ncbi:MAG TPA: selenium metabolism-associated LysR family transcriptional regulator [Pseudodesulfovibrio sp.]|nr:selenium metabolism-associated LysR family transcriptional regulator [Pseudodesulfovibrio sp.]
MDIRKLEAFCKVYELQSFSRAGEAMFLSQPTISSHVANLEDELGVKLFDRLGRKIMPTQAGDVLYESMVNIFQNLDRAKAAIEVLRDRVVGELQVGCSTIPSHSILPEMLKSFSAKYPEVSFVVHTGDSSEVIKRVSSGDWPVGIVGKRPDEEELTAKLLTRDETILVASPNAPWMPEVDEPSMEQLMALPWIMRIRGSATRMVLESALSNAGYSLQSLNIRCKVEGTCESLAHAVHGVGMCFTSKLAAQPLLDSGEVVRIKVPALEGRREFYLIHHSGRYMFPALKAFVEFHG